MKPFDLLNETFDRIFVVTLKRAADRQARIRERLRGLDYEFFWGIDKAELDVPALEWAGVYSEERARRLHRNGKAMTAGHIACSMSHRAIYEAILRNGWERVLVFEDDVRPRTADLAALAPALAELPAGWEVLYLGYDHGERFNARDRVKQAFYLLLAALRLIKWTPRQVLGLHSRPFSPHLRCAGKHHGTHAYAVSRSGAKRLLEAQTPVASNADQLLIRLCIGGEIEAFVTEPKLFDQESTLGSTGSYISERPEEKMTSPGAPKTAIAVRAAARGSSARLPHFRGPRDDSPDLAGAERSPAASPEGSGARSLRPRLEGLLGVKPAEREAGLALQAGARAEIVEPGLARAGGNGARAVHDPVAVAGDPPGELGVLACEAEDRLVHAVVEEEGAPPGGPPGREVTEVERIALSGPGVPE